MSTSDEKKLTLVQTRVELEVKKEEKKQNYPNVDQLLNWRSLSSMSIDMLAWDLTKPKVRQDIQFNFLGGYGDDYNIWRVSGFNANEPIPLAEWSQKDWECSNNEAVYYHEKSSKEIVNKVFEESLKYAKTLRLHINLYDNPIEHYNKMVQLCKEYAAHKGLHFQIYNYATGMKLGRFGSGINSWTNAELLKKLDKR